jgi:L-histidine N-alpha-methyltransferase
MFDDALTGATGMVEVAHEGTEDSLAAMVLRGLREPQKRLHPRFFYDALGSTLFEAITQLPWYPVARAEESLLRSHAASILAAHGMPNELVELGPGSGEKLAIFAERLAASGRKFRLHLIDISPAALDRAKARLQMVPGAEVLTYANRFRAGLAALPRPESHGRRLVLLLGSNIGNYSREEAVDFLRGVRGQLAPGDGLLIGADMVKPERELLLAYDDPLGVTAAFNKNLLLRMNRELGGDFDLGQFQHRVEWNSAEHRVEMHLESACEQRVHFSKLDWGTNFDAGETIWTESSHKYEARTLRSLGESAGFRWCAGWRNAEPPFLEGLFQA